MKAKISLSNAVMLAVILVLVIGTVRLVGSNANNAFSSVASSLQ
jgi:Flp pilus assembly pilin Flp